MSYKSINLGQKFRLFNEQWQPKVIAEMNGVLNTGHEGGERTAENDVWI